MPTLKVKDDGAWTEIATVGASGKTAYQYAVEGGYTGTETEFATVLASVVTKSSLLNLVYPVGSIYISTVKTSPAILFGGTWERMKDRFLLAAGDTYAAGATGGEAEHTLTIDEIAPHFHGTPYKVDWGSNTELGAWEAMFVDGTMCDTGGSGYTGNWHPYHTQPTGGGMPHNNMPPYLAVYMWKRTA